MQLNILLKAALLLCGLIFLSSCDDPKKLTNTLEPTAATQQKIKCEYKCDKLDRTLCENLFKGYKSCEKAETKSACTVFLSAFSKALPKTILCKNTCTGHQYTEYSRAITHQCDEIDPNPDYPKITERASHLLARLKFKEAKELLLSDDFYAILDGALSQDIKPFIEKAKQK